MPKLTRSDGKFYEFDPEEYEMYRFKCGDVLWDGPYPAFAVTNLPRLALYYEYKRNGTLPAECRYQYTEEETRIGEVVKQAYSTLQAAKGQHFRTIKAAIAREKARTTQEVNHEESTPNPTSPRLG